jgi:hypothetical protein
MERAYVETKSKAAPRLDRKRRKSGRSVYRRQQWLSRTSGLVGGLFDTRGFTRNYRDEFTFLDGNGCDAALMAMAPGTPWRTFVP